jgi:hypothetical protein
LQWIYKIVYTFREYISLKEDETSGLMRIRKVPDSAGTGSGPAAIQRPDTGLEGLFKFLSKLVLSFPGAAIRTIVNFATTLKQMGFTGNPDSLKAAISLGKLAIPPIVYTAARLGGLAVPELIAMLASPQFWEAYSRIGQIHTQGSFKPMVREFNRNSAFC